MRDELVVGGEVADVGGDDDDEAAPEDEVDAAFGSAAGGVFGFWLVAAGGHFGMRKREWGMRKWGEGEEPRMDANFGSWEVGVGGVLGPDGLWVSTRSVLATWFGRFG